MCTLDHHDSTFTAAGIEPSVGRRGDSYDNALAQTINGLCKAEVIHRRGPSNTKASVELATQEWVSWFNHHRLLAPIGNIPPADPLLKGIRHNPLLWLLVFVPSVFATQWLTSEAHTLLFVLSILAIVPRAVLLSHATESVAAKTGDAVSGLLNATLGNLTELIIALAALRTGQYALVKASIAGAIVANSLFMFMLGASLLLGGLKYHVQGIQPRQRPSISGPALPGHDRAVGALGGLRSRTPP